MIFDPHQNYSLEICKDELQNIGYRRCPRVRMS